MKQEMAAEDYKELRADMVRRQLRGRDITDERVLRAFDAVPREEFVPDNMRDLAYIDQPLEIGHGQTISQPYMVAKILEALELQGDERVLEVGGGSGYSAALLSHLCRQVVSIEWFDELAETAKETIERIGIRNVHVYRGDGSKGWAKTAPYDAIAYHAGAPEIPEDLFSQLAPGGRIVVPVSRAGLGEELQRITISEMGEKQTEDLGPCFFVPLLGEAGHKKN